MRCRNNQKWSLIWTKQDNRRVVRATGPNGPSFFLLNGSKDIYVQYLLVRYVLSINYRTNKQLLVTVGTVIGDLGSWVGNWSTLSSTFRVHKVTHIRALVNCDSRPELGEERGCDRNSEQHKLTKPSYTRMTGVFIKQCRSDWAPVMFLQLVTPVMSVHNQRPKGHVSVWFYICTK